MKINFKDEILILSLMSYLLESWNTVVVGINGSCRYGKLKFSEIWGIVVSEYREIENSFDNTLNVD